MFESNEENSIINPPVQIRNIKLNHSFVQLSFGFLLALLFDCSRLLLLWFLISRIAFE